MKKIILAFACCSITWLSVQQPAQAAANTKQILSVATTDISISNPADITREEEVVEIPAASFGNKWEILTKTPFRIINKQTGKEIPYQLVTLGQSAPVALLVQVSLAAKANVTLSIQPGQPAKVKPRTFGRFVPERKDDFAWENDRVVFRMYGPALENFPKENAHGIDFWSKRTSDLVVDTWYKLDNYHHDNGQGLDYYKVGFTLGAGDNAPFVGDSINFSKKYKTYKVLDNGPLRTTFQLIYDSWQAGSISVAATKTISLDAGSQLNKMSVQYVFNGDKLPVVAGIVKREEPGAVLLDEKQGVLGYWEPQHGEDGINGVGCVFPSAVPGMLVTSRHLLAKAQATASEPFVYYFGAAWNKAGRITNEQQWFTYLQQFARKIQQPLTVKVQ